MHDTLNPYWSNLELYASNSPIIWFFRGGQLNSRTFSHRRTSVICPKTSLEWNAQQPTFTMATCASHDTTLLETLDPWVSTYPLATGKMETSTIKHLYWRSNFDPWTKLSTAFLAYRTYNRDLPRISWTCSSGSSPHLMRTPLETNDQGLLPIED